MSAPSSTHAPDELLDPRIRRSRKMLHDALSSLLARKSLEKISIQEIAETATLNRATFYDHYPDKFSLLCCMVGSRFGELLVQRGVRVTSCDGALRALILATCDFLLDLPLPPCNGNGRSLPPSLQTAVIEILTQNVSQGLVHHPPQGSASCEVVAAAVAWGIYGSVNQWVQTPSRPPAETMALIIESLVGPLMLGAPTAHSVS